LGGGRRHEALGTSKREEGRRQRADRWGGKDGGVRGRGSADREENRRWGGLKKTEKNQKKTEMGLTRFERMDILQS